MCLERELLTHKRELLGFFWIKNRNFMIDKSSNFIAVYHQVLFQKIDS